MKRKLILAAFIIALAFSLSAQTKQQDGSLKREVTLYNPYKPSLPDVIKRSYLPDMTDSSTVRPDFKYNIQTRPFMPSYDITPLKPAALQPDPLPRLYNSFLNIGFGNYMTPLAELSISNERSKKGAIGIYARHFSTNGEVELTKLLPKVFAGYMDNDVSLFGKKFLKKSLLDGSIDFLQKIRYAYGYDTTFTGPEPPKNDIRLNYYNAGAKIGLASVKLDSSGLSYDFDLGYNFFYNATNLYQHNIGLKGIMAKSFSGFYAGSGIEVDYYRLSDSISINPEYVASLSPFIKKSTEEWDVKLGFQALIDKEFDKESKPHFYPDIEFRFSVVPTYVSFFAGLSGRLEKNEPLSIINSNPFLLNTGKYSEMPLFTIPNTSHNLIAKAGLQGNTGIEGTYQVSASYSVVDDELFFTNYVVRNGTTPLQRGNYFVPLYDDIEVLNIHGEMSGRISDKIDFELKADHFNYTVTEIDYAYNMPDWNGSAGVRFNLRDKVLAGLELTATGPRKVLISKFQKSPVPTEVFDKVPLQTNFNLNLSAEYRYTKILSFWMKFNNISSNKYYEWGFYPSQRFLFLAGFTYSL